MADPRLRDLPAVHVLAAAAAAATSGGATPRWAMLEAARRAIAARRAELIAGTASDATIDAAAVARTAAGLTGAPLRRVINATGVILHTNLGRAPLAAAARAAIDEVARGYVNLEYDLARGERDSRHTHLRDLLRTLTGGDDAVVVNNNAAATVLGLAALASDREIIVSRGELIEIGGSFRLPEILALSRGVMVEVGTTNKTHAADYERAIGERTALLLKVHRSNFAVVGFTAEVSARQLVELGAARGVATMIDLGSGSLLDVTAPPFGGGLPAELTVRDAVASGADLVAFSGDKLLGGPQAGILVGRAAAIARVKAHPLMRALRPDKLTIAGLAATLACYRDGRATEIPVVAMLAASPDQLRAAADALAGALGACGLVVAVEPCTSAVGGGALPTAELASWAVTLRGRSPDALDAQLRAAAVPVVARIAEDRVWLDVRTIAADEHDDVVAAVTAAARERPR